MASAVSAEAGDALTGLVAFPVSTDNARLPIRYMTGGGVVIHDGRVLLLDRPGRSEIRLPKGHIDPGETAAETALRETVEETGYVDLHIVRDLGSTQVAFHYQDRECLRTEHYFLMGLRSRAQIRRPCADQAQFHPIWRSLAEAVNLLTFAAERQVLAKAIRVWQQDDTTRCAID